MASAMECEDMANCSREQDARYATLSNFEVEKKIGKGQFSEVYRARCGGDRSAVALKKVQVCQVSFSLYHMC